MTIACFKKGCTNAVIGQCAGYEKPCGLFYCAEHSSEKLCVDCAQKKAEGTRGEERQEHEIEEEYLLEEYKIAAGNLRKERNQFSRQVELSYILPEIGLFVLFLLCIWLFILAGENSGLWILFGVCMLVFLMGASALGNSMGEKQRNFFQERLAEIEAEKPNFRQFYEEWDKLKFKEDEERFNRVMSELIGLGKDAYGVAKDVVEKSKSSNLKT